MLDTKSAISKRALLFAAAILIPAAAEATTTVTAEATIWQYRDQNFTGNYQPSAIFGEHYGMVGNIVDDIGTNHALDGAYASTI